MLNLSISDTINNSNSVNSKLMDWVNQQDVYAWAKFTLEYPYFTRKGLFYEPLKQTFAELSHTYPSSKIKKIRKLHKCPSVRRIGLYGGDYADGTALHFQGLIELFNDDLTHLKTKLQKAWSSAIVKQPQASNVLTPQVLRSKANVWAEKYVGDTDHYIKYLQRYEGNDLSYGVEKIETVVLALSPYRD